MIAIFSNSVEDIIKAFMDGFSMRGTSFDNCLYNLSNALERCEDMNFCLELEKFPFYGARGDYPRAYCLQ